MLARARRPAATTGSSGCASCAPCSSRRRASHTFTVDHPLRGPDGKVLAKVTRLEVLGDRLVQAVTVRVDPASAGAFSFASLIVPENPPLPG